MIKYWLRYNQKWIKYQWKILNLDIYLISIIKNKKIYTTLILKEEKIVLKHL